MSDENGELHGAICLFTDLTMVKQLEEQLRLKESLATVGELTAGIAHEFRNGLATILGYSKLCDPLMLPEAYRPYVAGIRAEAESLRSVVTNFLNFAKPATLTLSKVNLRAICERASEEVRAEARSLGGEVTLDGEFGALDGDEVLLRQAFSNLLRNAVEACAAAAVPPGRRHPIGSRSRASALTNRRRGQRPGHPAARSRPGVPSLLHVEAERHRASASRSCRRSSCSTTAASRSDRRRSAAPVSTSRFLSPADGSRRAVSATTCRQADRNSCDGNPQRFAATLVIPDQKGRPAADALLVCRLQRRES